jgi:ATP-dependent RNA helicase DeaD
VEREVTPPATGQERAAVVRGQNTIVTLPHDAAAIRHILGLVLDRLDEHAESGVQAVVLAADVDTVMAIGRIAASIDRPPHATLLAMPSAQRGARAMRTAPPSIVIATPDDLLALVRGSVAKLSAVRVAVFAWADALLDSHEESLATLIAELPKEAARILVAARLTSEVEQFAERYVRRISRAGAPAAEVSRIPLSYIVVSESAKPSALRRVLDTVDPETATVYARTEEGARAARAELAGMGSAAAGVHVVTEAAAAEGALLVLYELPRSSGDLRTLSSGTVTRTVAMVRARELPMLGAFTTAAPQPLPLGGPAERARTREAAMRDALRGVLADGLPAREILALEPLLEEYDGIEIAAAALRLLDRSRESAPAPRAAAAQPAAAPSAAPVAPPPPRGPVRVFFNAGSRDGATTRDFVGAIANVAGIPMDRIGKVEVRDSHALVELQGADAADVVEKLAGETIRGRRVAPRLDREKPGDRERHGNRESGMGNRGAGTRDRSAARERGPARERGATSRDRSGPARERSGPSRERSGPSRERSGPARERSGPARERSGPARERSGPPRERSSTRDAGNKRSAPSRGGRPAPRGRRES